MKRFSTLNPATEKKICDYDFMSKLQVLSVLQQASAIFSFWSQQSFEFRSTCLQKLAEVLRKNKKKYAEQMALEMGKPLVQAGIEVEKCAWACEYFANFGSKFLQDKIITTEAKKSYVRFEPLGVVFAVMPWNFPFWQVFRFAIPTLLAGNAVVFKHAPNTTGCGIQIVEAFAQAGFPTGVVSQVVVDLDLIEDIIAHPIVAGVSLTGSVAAGRSVAALAGKHLKKCVLELGGSDPYLILHDADLELASDVCVAARMNNAGQTCIAAKRLIVVEPILEKFTRLIKEKISRFIMGDPLDPKTTLGPMARADLREILHRQVEKSVKLGARCELGGLMCAGEGFFYPPTLLVQVKKGMSAFDEELFGPVAIIIAAKDEEEAITLANDSDFGLGAAVFTQDVVRGENIAATRLKSGIAAVNAVVKSDPRLPFGGIKNSGLGRELGEFGIWEFCNVKVVWVG